MGSGQLVEFGPERVREGGAFVYSQLNPGTQITSAPLCSGWTRGRVHSYAPARTMTTAQRSDAVAVSRPASENIRFIAVLRGAAALLVVWDHLGATWPEYDGKTWAVVKYVREGINTPFGIIQDFGWLGVSIFFLVSGFVITYVAQRETRTSFGVKRAFRILPPLWVSIGLILLLDWVLTAIHVAGSEGTFTFGQVLRSMVLLNYFLPRLATINGVGWTLAIEVAFYFLTFVFIGLVRKSPKTTLCVNLAIVMSVLLVRHGLGATGAYLVTDVSYIPILLLGQVMYFRWSGRVGNRAFALFSALALFEFVYGAKEVTVQFYAPGNSYGVSLLYAYAIFVGALLLDANAKLPYSRPIKFYSECSYSLYLVHGAIGFFVLYVLTPYLPLTICIIIAIAVASVTAWVLHLFIEKPSQRLARRMLRVQWKERAKRLIYGPT
jgi:peptidoglycan/LPS O-acetylase OafA/YrhL